jgi:uncharacterized protein Yka (UPF0111/DUF47 family)
MLSSKDAHFSYLEELDQKYQAGGQRALAEIAHLADLLETHNQCVARFAGVMRDLRNADAEAHSQLVSAIAELNRSLGNIEQSGASN